MSSEKKAKRLTEQALGLFHRVIAQLEAANGHHAKVDAAATQAIKDHRDAIDVEVTKRQVAVAAIASNNEVADKLKGLVGS